MADTKTNEIASILQAFDMYMASKGERSFLERHIRTTVENIGKALNTTDLAKSIASNDRLEMQTNELLNRMSEFITTANSLAAQQRTTVSTSSLTRENESRRDDSRQTVSHRDAMLMQATGVPLRFRRQNDEDSPSMGLLGVLTTVLSGLGTLAVGGASVYMLLKGISLWRGNFTEKTGIEKMVNAIPGYFVQLTNKLFGSVDSAARTAASASDDVIERTGLLSKIKNFLKTNPITKFFTIIGAKLTSIGKFLIPDFVPKFVTGAGFDFTKIMAKFSSFAKIFKKLPFIGGIISLGMGIKRIRAGDIFGGVLEFISGIASFTGVGFVASLGIDAFLALRDLKNSDGTFIKKPVGAQFTEIFKSIGMWISRKMRVLFDFLKDPSTYDDASQLLKGISVKVGENLKKAFEHVSNFFTSDNWPVIGESLVMVVKTAFFGLIDVLNSTMGHTFNRVQLAATNAFDTFITKSIDDTITNLKSLFSKTLNTLTTGLRHLARDILSVLPDKALNLMGLDIAQIDEQIQRQVELQNKKAEDEYNANIQKGLANIKKKRDENLMDALLDEYDGNLENAKMVFESYKKLRDDQNTQLDDVLKNASKSSVVFEQLRSDLDLLSKSKLDTSMLQKKIDEVNKYQNSDEFKNLQKKATEEVKKADTEAQDKLIEKITNIQQQNAQVSAASINALNALVSNNASMNNAILQSNRPKPSINVYGKVGDDIDITRSRFNVFNNV